MKCVFRVRYLVFLALVYLVLVLLLYYYLWQDHSLAKLLETPEGFEGTFTDDLDYDYGENVEDQGRVEFNFRRNPAPQGVKIFNGHVKRPRNSSRRGPHTPYSVQPLSHSNTTSSMNTSSAGYSALPSPTLEKAPQDSNVSLPAPSQCLHAFYYAWYGNIESDGKYMHWNHRYLPHWKDSITRKFPQGRHVPPDDIGASFYPELGCYSSKDPVVVETHMAQLRAAGVGVAVVSWYPPGLADDEGPPPDPVIPVLLDAALAHGVKLTLHIEPYRGRTPQSVRNDLRYIHTHYTSHPAFYKLQRVSSSDGKSLPLIYIYDSYLSEAKEWAMVFKPGSSYSVRGKDEDCIAIALLVEHSHMKFAVDGGFDGVYTYFAAEGFSFGSTYKNWVKISDFAAKNNLLFIPSFGPGYDDTQVRPWNKLTSRGRKNGAYYEDGFRRAKEHNTGGIISVTSFNEWGEGTQIEPAVPKTTELRTYLSYSPQKPDHYLQLTREMANELFDCGIT